MFVQTSDGRLVALDAKDGSRRWTFDTQVPVLTLRGTGFTGVYLRIGTGVVLRALPTVRSARFARLPASRCGSSA